MDWKARVLDGEALVLKEEVVEKEGVVLDIKVGFWGKKLRFRSEPACRWLLRIQTDTTGRGASIHSGKERSEVGVKEKRERV